MKKWIKNNILGLIIGLGLATVGGIALANNLGVLNATQKGDVPVGVSSAGNYQLQHPCSNGLVLAASSTSVTGWACVSTSGSAGLTSINNATGPALSISTGIAGTIFNLASTTNSFTFNLPFASASNTGQLQSADWTTFNNKQNALTLPLSVTNGGTGSQTITSTDVLFGNGTSPIATSSNFTFTTATNNLFVTNSSSTNLSVATRLYLNGLLVDSLGVTGTPGSVFTASTTGDVWTPTQSFTLGSLSASGTNITVAGGGNVVGSSTTVSITNSPSFSGTLSVTGTSTLATTTISQLTLGNGLVSTILAVNSSGQVIATTTSAGGVTAVNGSGSILSSGGATPTIQLQNLANTDILFGLGTNIIGTSTTFTYSTTTDRFFVTNASSTNLTVSGQTVLGNASTTALTVSGLSYHASTTITGTLSVTGVPTLSGVANCNGTSFLQFTSGLFGCGTPSGGGGGSGAGWATSSPNYVTTNYPNTTGTNVGINSSTPIAQLVVQGISGSTTPVFIVSSSTGANLLKVTSGGQTLLPGYPVLGSTPAIAFLDSTNTGIGSGGSPTSALNFYAAGVDVLDLQSTAVIPNVPIVATTGSAATPSYSFANDTTEGMFRASGNQLAFSSGGVERLRLNNQGYSGFNSTSPTATLVVQGYTGSTTPTFIVSSSTGASQLQVTALGNVNIATLTATTLLASDANKNLQSVTLTTTGSSGAATFIGNTLNIPQYSGGGGGSGVSSTTPFTNGHVPYATSTGALTDSPIVANGIVVGVNATTSNANFTVQQANGFNPFEIKNSLGAIQFGVDANNTIIVEGNKDIQADGTALANQSVFVSSASTSPITTISGILNGPQINLLNATTTIVNYISNWTSPVFTQGTVTRFYGNYISQPIITASDTIGSVYGIVVLPSASTTAYTVFNGFGTSTPSATLTLQGSPGQTADLFNIASSSGASLFSISSQTYGSLSVASSTMASGGTPAGILQVYGNTVNNLPLLFLASSSNATILKIDAFGHMITGGDSPTCGSGCSSVTGDDHTFRAVTGSGVTAVTVNFAHAYSNSPICVGSDESGGTTTSDPSSTPTSVTINLSASLTSKNLGVICQGSVNITN